MSHETITPISDSTLADSQPNRPSNRRTQRRVIGLALGLAAGIAGVLLVARERSTATAATAAAAAARDNTRDVPYLDNDLIRFSDGFAKRAGLTTTAAAERALSPMVNVTGTVTWDTRRFAAVGARIPGRVRDVFKVMGDSVKTGDLLAEIESAELGRAEGQALAARAREIAAEADMKREADLAEARVSSRRDAEFARAAYDAAKAERVAAERTVQALGGDLGGHQLGVLRLRAPVAGRVVAAEVTRGQTVDATATLFEIADRNAVWVELSVFERDLETVRAGDKVEISPQTNTKRTLTGTVAVVGEAIDHETRSAPVRVEVSNTDQQLRPGQSVLARINVSGPTGTKLSIPRTAVTRVDGKATVFVLVDKNTVTPRAVLTGAEDSSHLAILDGLKPGDQVVVGGLLAIKSEIFR